MTAETHDELAVLTRAAQAGDLQAYGRIVERTRGAVEAAARVVLHDPVEAEDVAQETYLQAHDRLDELRDGGTLVGWLMRMARNRALNRRRADHWSFVRDVDLSEVVAPAQDEEDEHGAALARAMLTLDAEDRRLCERFYHGGWPTARLATEMKIGEAAVRKRLQRLRT